MESGSGSIGGVGSIVWVSKNGTWWPGKILATEELPASHSPKTGTPIKLLGREDGPVDWYDLENSKSVKAFRCVDFDCIIERITSSQGMLPKTREKYTRRGVAILQALELEKELFRKQGKLDTPADATKSSGSAEMGSGGLLTSIEGETVSSSIHFPKDHVGNQPSWENDHTKILPQKRRLQDFELKTACVKQELTSNDALYVDETQSPSSRVASMERIMQISGGEQMGCDSQAKRSRCKDLPPESFDVSYYKKTSPSQIEISSSHFRKCDSYPSPDYFIGGKISEFMEVVESGLSESTSSESESESDTSETEPDVHEDITSHSGKISPKEAGGGTSAALRPSTLSRANCFGSENPFFIINVRKSYINGHDVHIPLPFARKYLTRKEAKTHVVLKDQDGRAWPVHLKVSKRYCFAQFGLGWKEFAFYNDLRVGDSCAYELLEGPEMSFRVTVFRNAEDSNDLLTGARGDQMGTAQRERELNAPSQLEGDYSSEDEVIRSSTTNKESHVPRRKIKTKNSISGKFGKAMQNETVAPRVGQSISSEGTARDLERASEFRSDHPFFKVVITARFLRLGNPSIPKSFSDVHIERLPQDATLLFKGKSWPLTMRPCLDRPGTFGAGWHTFAGENNLQAGDVCVFEMTEKTNMVLKVSIIRDGFILR